MTEQQNNRGQTQTEPLDFASKKSLSKLENDVLDAFEEFEIRFKALEEKAPAESEAQFSPEQVAKLKEILAQHHGVKE